MLPGQAPQYGVPQGVQSANHADHAPDEESQTDMVTGSYAQPTIILPTSLPAPVPIGGSWNEVQTADGRVYYFNADTGKSEWSRPADVMTENEKPILDTTWREMKIWDGRSYFYNAGTNCSVWHTPPEVELARGAFDPQLKECVDFDSLNVSEVTATAAFLHLLEERGVNDNHSFTEAMNLIGDDPRSHGVPSDKARQLIFSSYISAMMKKRIQSSRDAKRELYIQAIKEWKEWKGMSESTTFTQIEALFKERQWFKSLDQADLRKLFHAFSLEFIEIEKLKKRKLQDALMHDMKNDILARVNQIDLAKPHAIETIVSTYSNMKPQPQFWTYLSDSQKLVVIKSCISQKIRDFRMAVANKLPLTREKRSLRQEKDRIKLEIQEAIRSKAESKIVKRGQGLVLPEWNQEMEAFLTEKGVDLVLAKDLFIEFLDDMKQGRDPLAGIV
jgi:hypothetical protein